MKLIFYAAIFVFIISSCTTHWTTAVRSGKVVKESFNETINFEEKLGLIIIPVVIKGKTYRFLWDTGATSIISVELQDEYQFKTVSKGHYVDTDNNRKPISYVRVDTISLGNIVFADQTAFVEDFKANPIINCLNVDGIIGGNLMRYCNWTIDYDNTTMTMSSQVPQELKETALSIPFKYDNDFDLIVNVKIGRAKISNMNIDYGSNGSLSFPQKILDVLKERSIVTETFLETGSKNSGLIGKTVEIEREHAYTDSLFIGDQMLADVEIKVGRHALIGKKILSRYVVTIDWDEQMLYFNNYTYDDEHNNTFGFTLGVREKEIYVQSVTEYSDAYIKGLKPEMVVEKLNELDFTKSATYCEYIDLINSKPEELTLEYKDEEGSLKTVKIEPRGLSK